MAETERSLPPTGMKLFRFLAKLMGEKYSGEVVLSFNQGGFRDAKWTVRTTAADLPEA